MCGLAGFVLPNGNFLSEKLLSTANKLSAALIQRGPDDSGVWADANNGLALAHRRLSIIDLSTAGHQPMASASDRFVIAFNGEIYNHLSLRAELDLSATFKGDSIKWRGHSDTETLLAGFETWGIEATLQRAVGMFAIAVWDKISCSLTLARDRLGEKPLYYGWVGSPVCEASNGGDQLGELSLKAADQTELGKAFVFGSELKALKAYQGFNNEVCREALAEYMRFMVVPAPRSIYKGIYKLEPGCMLTIKGAPPPDAPLQPIRPGQSHGSVSIKRWWALSSVVEQGSVNLLNDEAQAIKQLESTLSEAVRLQSLADVPLGAFLSGGVDSSTIVALMQQQAKEAGQASIKTFTIGFNESGFDEAPYARAVANHLGTEHHEMRVTSDMAQAVIPLLPHMYDEPFADSSQIPTHLVCQSARKEVTVALSGDAGDELFGGYNRYFWGPRIWNRLSWLPFPARKVLGECVSAVPVEVWNALSTLVKGNKSGGVNQTGAKLHKIGQIFKTSKGMSDLYLSLLSEWQDPGDLVISDGVKLLGQPDTLMQDPLPTLGLNDQALEMMYRDSMMYLTDDILCKVDRAAMACSLETRVPFLDHRVVELAWQLPLKMKIRNNQGKWALRQVLYKHVPRELIERPKAGFAIPIGQWLRGPLREWGNSLLDEQRLKQEGYLKPAPILQAWKEHLTGRIDHTPKLWAVLMFQSWLEVNR
jgi:asparagine synthase (glutamine-hydrolysing)